MIIQNPAVITAVSGQHGEETWKPALQISIFDIFPLLSGVFLPFLVVSLKDGDGSMRGEEEKKSQQACKRCLDKKEPNKKKG